MSVTEQMALRREEIRRLGEEEPFLLSRKYGSEVRLRARLAREGFPVAVSTLRRDLQAILGVQGPRVSALSVRASKAAKRSAPIPGYSKKVQKKVRYVLKARPSDLNMIRAAAEVWGCSVWELLLEAVARMVGQSQLKDRRAVQRRWDEMEREGSEGDGARNTG